MTEKVETMVQEPLVLHTSPVLEMSNDQFFRFCQLNRDLRIERTAEGDLIIMAPAGGSSGSGNIELTSQLLIWAKADATGRAFDSSTGFVLPNQATRSPDAAWVRRERIEALSDEEWAGFLPLCPDFVVELRSPSDPLGAVQEKMEEYMVNGATLGWLIDPQRRQVHIYRAGAKPEILDNPNRIQGDPLLPGFVLNVREIWAAMTRRRRP